MFIVSFYGQNYIEQDSKTHYAENMSARVQSRIELCFACLRELKQESEEMNIKRGDIYYADLSPVVGSEQGGIRPVLIVQNDVGNKYSPTVIAAAITSQKYKTKLPTHISVDAVDCGLQKDSIVLLGKSERSTKSVLKSVWETCLRMK